MSYLFSSESVSEGHPDKVSDQISDAILDQFLAYDRDARVACETFVTTGQVVIMGEVKSREYIDLQTVARNTIKKIGYTKAEYQFDYNSCCMAVSEANSSCCVETTMVSMRSGMPSSLYCMVTWLFASGRR